MLRSCLLLLLTFSSAQAATKITIAAAANLAQAIEPLTAAFEANHPDIETEVTLGSSGSLVAQIIHGAPFDIFLSADMGYPRALIEQGQADPDTLFAFAEGRLVLWTTRDDISFSTPIEAIRNTQVRTIAIANPDTAPYGRAARQVLQQLALLQTAQPRIVVGENVSQTAQFVSSGNADLGFIALSLVLTPHLKNRGSWIELPLDSHAPLTQGAVLTQRGTKRPAARDFLTFLQSAEARKIFARYGYRVPASP